MKRTIERKTGNKWIVTYEQTNDEQIIKSLATDLAAKYIGKAEYIKRIARRNNYDGTQTYTVTYNNDTRAIYLTDIY